MLNKKVGSNGSTVTPSTTNGHLIVDKIDLSIYSLPAASTTTLGGVKVGTGLTVSNDGVLNTSTTTVPLADQIVEIHLDPPQLIIQTSKIKPLTNQKIYVYYLNNDVKIFDLPSLQVDNNHQLRLNPSTGVIRSSYGLFFNEIALLVNINNEFVGGALYPYIQYRRTVDISVITPKTYNTFPLTISQGAMQSFAFINDQEIWVFDKDINTSTIYRRDPNTFALIGSLGHNLGYFNSCDYNSTLDTIVTGNGTGFEDYTDIRVTIYYNVSSWVSMTGVDRTNTQWVDIDLNGLNTSGNNDFKVQGMWGDNNLGKNNIIYIITNDGRNIRKLLLGMGSNNLGSGIFASSVASNKFNGTYKILDLWQQDDGGGHSQDCYFYNGAVYSGSKDSIVEHGLLFYKHILCTNGVIDKVKILIPLYDDVGNPLNVDSTEGLTIHNGILYVGLMNNTPNYLFTFSISM